jgi:hypothetical protein
MATEFADIVIFKPVEAKKEMCTVFAMCSLAVLPYYHMYRFSLAPCDAAGLIHLMSQGLSIVRSNQYQMLNLINSTLTVVSSLQHDCATVRSRAVNHMI